MEQPHPTKIPTPPSSRPTSLRRARRKYENRLLNENINQSPILYQEPSVRKTECEQEEVRLQKYKILPAIGSSSDLRSRITDSVNGKFERSTVGDSRSGNYSSTYHRDDGSGTKIETVINKQNNDYSTNNETISKIHSSSQCDVDEQLEIAIRLPDGSRRQSSFSSSSSFMHLLEYLINSSVNDEIIPRNCEFVTSDVPRQVFSDFNVTLRQAKLKTRTLLYLREVDPD